MLNAKKSGVVPVPTLFVIWVVHLLIGCGGTAAPTSEANTLYGPSRSGSASDSIQTLSIAELEARLQIQSADAQSHDIRLRLAALYTGESDRFLAPNERSREAGFVPNYSGAITLLEQLLLSQGEGAATPEQRVEAAWLLGHNLHETGRPQAGDQVWLNAVCPNHSASVGLDAEGGYQTCRPIHNGVATARIWEQLGTQHAMTNEYGLSEQAFERCLTVYEIAQTGRQTEAPDVETRQHAIYMLGWIGFRQNRYRSALDRFAMALSLNSESPNEGITNESIAYSAAILANPDWNQDGTPDSESPELRCRTYLSAHPNLPEAPYIVLATAVALGGQDRIREAARVISITDDEPDRFVRSEVERTVGFIAALRRR